MSKAARTRSAVTNGTTLFLPDRADGRSPVARRWSDVYAAIVSDRGGAGALSQGELSMARSITTIAVNLEIMDAAFVAGGEPDMDLYGTLTDRLGRALGRLGMKRLPRDVTPDLEDYARDAAARARPGALDA